MEKHIAITGASSGVGLATAEYLIRETSARVLIMARSEEKMQAWKNGLSSEHQKRVYIYGLDLMHIDQGLVQVFEGFLGDAGLDALVHNAGAMLNKPFLEISLDEMNAVYQTNVFGLAQLTQLAHPFLKKNQGHIVHISSMGGFQGASKFPGLSIYSSSKAAVSCMTECLAEEFKEDGIKVNALCLGAVQTEMLEKAFPGYEANMDAKTMGKYVGQFALEGHSWFNGKVLPVSNSTP